MSAPHGLFSSNRLASKVLQCNIYNILLVETHHKSSPDVRGIPSHLKMLQRHIANGMDTVWGGICGHLKKSTIYWNS